ncbi:hypothetical protein [Rhodalgimonas zhirmunskyi]|uniref:Uncharacterized protein n=1 Tax=Rhodalgimonas zhirmunskyi TaxID=2964767 RepID=A0AAJ1U7T6_9RHOB|nr:hypothetical protein [Rhodoalgimonas zhirmunskyi]MDQ2094544.1 hypothetical protein [Rhodoalgimonas zhirmunskyi]
MGLKKLSHKLEDYNQRLERGEARKIEAGHVIAILEKLRNKHAELEAEIEKAKSVEKKDRLKRKLAVAEEQITRAEWLLEEIS